MIKYKTFSFQNPFVDEILSALKGSYAVQINKRWCYPISVEYSKRDDTLTFKLDYHVTSDLL